MNLHANLNLPVATRKGALDRLQKFLPRAGRDYAANRNFDLGPSAHEHVSCLSPYLRTRLLSEAEVIQDVLAHHSRSSAEKFVQEVLWRTYWKGWLEMRPAVWGDYNHDLQHVMNALQQDQQRWQVYQNAIHAQTGIECFDAWTNELINTGYVHNHARMWFASIWIFTLGLPWQLGAEFFLHHLLDGDPASNTLGWRWVAGIQTKGKHYLARASNIQKFTRGRFYPTGQLTEHAAPLQDSRAYSKQPYDAGDDLPDDNQRVGLLIDGEDLSPEISCLGSITIHAIAGIPFQAINQAQRFSTRVEQFYEQALGDALGRASVHWNAQTTIFEHDSLSHPLRQWVEENQLDCVVKIKNCAGPWRDQLRTLPQSLPAPVRLHQIRRRWDIHLHPFATSGFFSFKKKIPAILAALV